VTARGVVVVGAGLTAAVLAETLRNEGWTGPVTIVGAEPHRPYERPVLSKGYLLGNEPRDAAFVHPPEWYPDHDVDLRTGVRVVAVDRVAAEAVLDDGTRLPYDDLVLATGASPRRLDVPGADLPGVRYLRRIEDADRLLAAFGDARRLAVVGGGWIGLEVTAAARAAGLDVTVLEAGDLPLGRVLGPEMARVFVDLHREHGVDVRTGVQVRAIEADGGRRVAGVRLGDGSLVPADLVVVGIGAVPETGLAEQAGLEVRGGVVVDEHLRTADPRILAAGDVALAPRPALGGRALRVEHWANARRHGELAACTIMGADAVDERLPYFYTDQYDLGMEYVGYAEPEGPEAYDEVAVRGDLGRRELIAFWLREGRAVAGMNVNVWDVTEDIEALIRAGGGPDDREWPVP